MLLLLPLILMMTCPPPSPNCTTFTNMHISTSNMQRFTSNMHISIFNSQTEAPAYLTQTTSLSTCPPAPAYLTQTTSLSPCPLAPAYLHKPGIRLHLPRWPTRGRGLIMHCMARVPPPPLPAGEEGVGPGPTLP